MKKIFSAILVCIMTIGLVECGGNEESKYTLSFKEGKMVTVNDRLCRCIL